MAPRTAVTDDARPSGELIRVLPRDRAEGVQATDRLEVRAPRGRLEGVQVTEVHQGISRTVPGRISADGHDWRPESAGDAPRLGSRYTVDVVARDPSGRRSRRHTGFSTYAPSQRFIGYFTPEPQSTVGTGMIVSFSFDRPIADRAAVERAVRITARPATEVVGHWFGNDRLDFRPRHYWRAGTRVTMDLRLRDVRGAEGVYGLQRKTVAFTVGRDQTSTVDAAAHTMRVVRDGKPLAILPITAGAQGTETYNGKMVISQKFNVTRMNGNTVGFGGEYDISDVPHAMRLTASGTFLHGNYWAGPGTFGGAQHQSRLHRPARRAGRQPVQSGGLVLRLVAGRGRGRGGPFRGAGGRAGQRAERLEHAMGGLAGGVGARGRRSPVVTPSADGPSGS
ncbi:hypothetical protein GCM10020000_24620 [Streptomyces olivoverticillatus]